MSRGKSSAKLPALQFYPGDWKKDVGVQSLSFHDRGVWFEMLLLMHESEQRGMLLLNGRPMPEEAIARAIGLDIQELKQTLSKLVEYGVASVDQETGALMSRRMVRDEMLRAVRSEAGKQGGNPALLKQNQTSRDIQSETPSSSVSSSKNIPPTPIPPDDDASLHGRVLCEKIGCFAFKEQTAIAQALTSHARISKKSLGQAGEYMASRWDEYQKACPNLEWQHGSSYKFFMSGKWDTPSSWPWKQGCSPPQQRVYAM